MIIDRLFLEFLLNDNTLTVTAGILIGIVVFGLFNKLYEKFNKEKLMETGLFFCFAIPLLSLSAVVLKSIVLSAFFVVICAKEFFI